MNGEDGKEGKEDEEEKEGRMDDDEPSLTKQSASGSFPLFYS